VQLDLPVHAFVKFRPKMTWRRSLLWSTQIRHNLAPARYQLVAPKSVETDDKTRWAKLGESTWKMEEPLTKMFAKKEAACLSSRLVFKELSNVQMNFRPASRTHTPRWNAEHMTLLRIVFNCIL